MLVMYEKRSSLGAVICLFLISLKIWRLCMLTVGVVNISVDLFLCTLQVQVGGKVSLNAIELTGAWYLTMTLGLEVRSVKHHRLRDNFPF
jgi:hypothetical protein